LQSLSEWQCDTVDWSVKEYQFFDFNWLPWQRPLGNLKNWADRENSRKYRPFGEKIVKIGPVDTEIALLIVKKEN